MGSRRCPGVMPWLPCLPKMPSWSVSCPARNLLRHDLGFNGVAISDAMDMGAIVQNFTRPTAAVMAVKAGIDLIAVGPHTPIAEQLAMKQAILDAVAKGEIPPSRIEEAVRRI